ncbi:acyltransferase family protein [Burkholderia ubonensis]|uniref:acyltransferase family protein n=1 Tax=Burkholderia ubonensis TaxID=101571 RepID=UPI0009B4CB89|nr:acyltransferase [Burkholderia ubonensis]
MVEPPKNPNRFDSLDVLRGFAALIVVLYHATLCITTSYPDAWRWINWSPLRGVWAGHQAVIMFFVLSGFALTCMVSGAQSFRYSNYLVARIVRLYPPYVASVGIALCIFGGLAAIGAQWDAGWMNTSKPHLTASLALGHVLFIGVFPMGEINTVLWSLVYEMRISIAFPLILYAVSRFGTKAVAVFIGCSCLYWLRYKHVEWTWTETSVANLLETVHYATFFAMGAWLAINLEWLRMRLAKLLPRSRMLLALLAYVLFAYPFNDSFHLAQRALGDIFIGIGASLAIVLTIDFGDSATFRLGKWLGKVSYSLYLTHMPILQACIILLYRDHGPWITCATAIAIALTFARIFNAAIEVPSIRLGRMLTKRYRAPRLTADA